MTDEFPPRRRSLTRVCFVGDAFVAGAGDESALGIVGRLALDAWSRNHDVTAYNLGVRADPTPSIARRWRAECEARLPPGADARLVFMFGGNDAKETVGKGIEVPLEASVANARALLGEAAAWLPTLWIGLVPMSETLVYPKLLPGSPEYRFDNARQAEYSRRYGEVAAELGVAYFDLHAALTADPQWQSLTQRGDGSNPPAAGYARIASLIAGWSAWREWYPD